MRYKIFLVLLSLAITVGIGSCWKFNIGKDLASAPVIVTVESVKIENSNELQLVTLDFPPMAYEENGEAKGIAVAIVREAFKRMGYTHINITVYPWGRSLNMVKAGEVDAIFTIYKTPAREQYLDFSNQVVLSQDIALFALRGNSIQYTGRLTDLGNYNIGVQGNISLGDYFDAVRQSGKLHIDEAGTTKATMEKLLDKRVDVVTSNRYTALAALTQLGKMEAVEELTPPVQEVLSYIAFSKKRSRGDLRDEFDRVLFNMKKDGSYDSIINEYFARK